MMKAGSTSAVIATFLFIVVLLPSATAHVPTFGGAGDSPDNAGHIHNPLKSWVVYDELHEGAEAHYYSVDMEAGQRLRITLFTPEEGFVPGLVVIGPGVEANGTVPAYVDVPPGLNALILEGEEQDSADYEPFTPASYFYTVDFDWTVTEDGEYYLAVYEPNEGGKYGVAIGYLEEFTLMEWLSVPSDAIGIHEWEGQSSAVIIAPLLLTLIIGTFALVWPPDRPRLTTDMPIWRWLGSFSGLLYIGTGVMMLSQMGIALSRSGFVSMALVTLIFVLIPIVLGVAVLYLSLKSEDLTVPKRVTFIVLALVALFMWAGLYAGPVIGILAAVVPRGMAIRARQEDASSSEGPPSR